MFSFVGESVRIRRYVRKRADKIRQIKKSSLPAGCRALWGRRSKYLSTFMKKIVITIVAKLPISDVGGGGGEYGYAFEENVVLVSRAYVASILMETKDLSALRNSFLVLPFELPIVTKCSKYGKFSIPDFFHESV